MLDHIATVDPNANAEGVIMIAVRVKVKDGIIVEAKTERNYHLVSYSRGDESWLEMHCG